MLTQAIPAVQQLRRVQGFDPLRFLKRNANGGIELEPRYQRLWFRLACPDGKMLLNRLQITDQIAVYEAQVFLSREDNQPITNFTAAVEKAQAPAGRYVQAAQDEALKTALDNAGFGIQLCEITPSATVDLEPAINPVAPIGFSRSCISYSPNTYTYDYNNARFKIGSCRVDNTANQIREADLIFIVNQSSSVGIVLTLGASYGGETNAVFAKVSAKYKAEVATSVSWTRGTQVQTGTTVPAGQIGRVTGYVVGVYTAGTATY